ncbi:MAG: immunoglobulin domain-containing protein [Planctomycetes bacterium]|nr:immunoglobulin domain-containing protein [Planctomycetota bacterium]
MPRAFNRRSLFALACGLLPAIAGTHAAAQCAPRWINGGEAGGPGGLVYAMTQWDPDGTGPQAPVLVVGGTFTSVAGDSAIRYIATWNGVTWAPLGNGGVAARALAVLPNGDLIAGGDVAIAGGYWIARWDGSSWAPLGSGVNDRVNALKVTASGDLIAGGHFTTAGGAAASRIARWSPATQTWSPIGAGVNGAVYSLAQLPSGDLVVGGAFTTAGGISARFIARWVAATGNWSTIGATPINNLVTALAVLPGGQFIAGGYFTSSGGFPTNYIARWDGAAWQQMGAGGMNSNVSAMMLMPDGNLLAGGNFTIAGGGVPANRIAIWNTASGTWSAIGPGIGGGVYAVATFAGEPIAGGNFQTTGTGQMGIPYFAHYGQPVAPTVTEKPADAIACANEQTSFEVSTAGSAPITYQWQIGTGAGTWASLALDPIALPCGGSAYAAGATARRAAISISPCAGITTYQVRCVVTNDCGTDVSDPATITMNSQVVPDDPQDAAACPGGTVSFSTTANGYGPYTFMWFKDDQPINIEANPSAATAELVLNNLTADDAGRYNCLVRNSCSGAYTNYATLTIDDATCCIGDFNQDGGIDGADVQAFFAEWELGNPSADVNADGGVDGADVEYFYIRWEAGC